jgi:hypothetical protein
MTDPIVGKRYSWPAVSEEFTVQEVKRRESVFEGVLRVDVSVRISEFGWLPWCGGSDFVAT